MSFRQSFVTLQQLGRCAGCQNCICQAPCYECGCWTDSCWKNKGCVFGACTPFVFGCVDVLFVYICLPVGCSPLASSAALITRAHSPQLIRPGHVCLCVCVSGKERWCTWNGNAEYTITEQAVNASIFHTWVLCSTLPPIRHSCSRKAYCNTRRHTTRRHCLPVSAPHAQATSAQRQCTHLQGTAFQLLPHCSISPCCAVSRLRT